MMVYEHSILYCIVLKNPVNIFDVVPEVMRKHRREILYGVKGFHPGHPKPKNDDDDDTRDYFCVVKDPESDDRLVASQFFKEHKANWFVDNRHFWKILDTDLTQDIRLTEQEEALRQTFLAHELIKDNVLHDGWVEIGYTH